MNQTARKEGTVYLCGDTGEDWQDLLREVLPKLTFISVISMDRDQQVADAEARVERLKQADALFGLVEDDTHLFTSLTGEFGLARGSDPRKALFLSVSPSILAGEKRELLFAATLTMGRVYSSHALATQALAQYFGLEVDVPELEKRFSQMDARRGRRRKFQEMDMDRRQFLVNPSF